MSDTIRFSTDADGIATLLIDVPGQSMNVIGAQFIADLNAAVDRISGEDAIKGAVIASGKDSGFMAGMDLKAMEAMLLPPAGEALDMKTLFNRVFELNSILRRLETCGKPVACAIEGVCVGGGFELALACHRRIVGDNPRTQIGLPEILVGLFPGGGGSQRFPRITGVQTALMYMLQGKLFAPAGAKADRRGRSCRNRARRRQSLGEGEPDRGHSAVGPERLQGSGRWIGDESRLRADVHGRGADDGKANPAQPPCAGRDALCRL